MKRILTLAILASFATALVAYVTPAMAGIQDGPDGFPTLCAKQGAAQKYNCPEDNHQ